MLVSYALMSRQLKQRNTVMQQAKTALLVEVFPVQTAMIPPLIAYQLQVRSGDLATIGGKLAYRLQNIFKGHWFWTERRVVTDLSQRDEALKQIIVELWKE